jgi:hypothetical protein
VTSPQPIACVVPTGSRTGWDGWADEHTRWGSNVAEHEVIERVVGDVAEQVLPAESGPVVTNLCIQGILCLVGLERRSIV